MQGIKSDNLDFTVYFVPYFSNAKSAIQIDIDKYKLDN